MNFEDFQRENGILNAKCDLFQALQQFFLLALYSVLETLFFKVSIGTAALLRELFWTGHTLPASYSSHQ